MNPLTILVGIGGLTWLATKDKYYVYKLFDGRKLVYIGTSNNPENRRKREHEISGKIFTRMDVVEKKLFEKDAKKREKELLVNYRTRNKGKNPKYNKKLNG